MQLTGVAALALACALISGVVAQEDNESSSAAPAIQHAGQVAMQLVLYICRPATPAVWIDHVVHGMYLLLCPCGSCSLKFSRPNHLGQAMGENFICDDRYDGTRCTCTQG